MRSLKFIGCIHFSGYVHKNKVLTFNSCDDKSIQEEYEYLEELDKRANDPELSEDARIRAWVMADMRRTGSLCPVTPKIKVRALSYMFGVLALILVGYNILRNVCSVRIE